MKSPKKSLPAVHLLRVLIAAVPFSHLIAEDWGAYSIAPVSAPMMVLEAVGAGTADGTVISLNKPAGTPNQKWVITPKGDNVYSIKPAYSSTLALAVAKGGKNSGAQIVLETESGQPSQLWTLAKQENGNYSLIPKHAPDMGIDDNGGKQTPGRRSISGSTIRTTSICNGSSSRWRGAR